MLSPLITTVPCPPCVTPLTEGVPANTSLASTATLTGMSSPVLAVSATADVIVTFTVATSVTPPELAVYVKLSGP